MAAPTNSAVLSLYRQLLREGRKVTDYNFRNYALRRVKDAFRANKDVSDSSQIETLLVRGQENLGVLTRQASISQLYSSEKLVIESQQKAGSS